MILLWFIVCTENLRLLYIHYYKKSCHLSDQLSNVVNGLDGPHIHHEEGWDSVSCDKFGDWTWKREFYLLTLKKSKSWLLKEP